ncbi:phosphoribosylaminoimidazole carboxylase catalytic subunit [Arthrobacter globiformis NBRC 12137]|uniref:N5-carboxyaminoimidazole ribonucleotide mutase n=1 Tax=Arthrobacter globiformis (strain ATCC 8010 / DSM 20124 / JCM 1332 / NBRC 12137 / NCIMB 8907 / NRRL B-2979 / 168) TaxID=1077972 RepID=H0QH83_ARTG1|nr:phosphoribosylaminoimidazole carboxylase catalytic subunit [Arthrobacter globiformis NBRC 12137]
MSHESAAAPETGAPAPLVGLVMGSDSDWPVMEAAADALAEFGIPFEADVVSAHRMPTEMIRYGQTAHERGLRVIIAGAGGAAHLPGMLASVTPLPVIGVPVPLKTLDGMDSLLSIVQMPAGVPWPRSPSRGPGTQACSPSACWRRAPMNSPPASARSSWISPRNSMTWRAGRAPTCARK